MVAVLVPWRSSGDVHREAAWSWVQARYAEAHPDWEVIAGSCPDGPWVKSLAVSDALSRTDADTILIADADVWCDGLQKAVDALETLPWAIPHLLVHRLTQEATQTVIDGGVLQGPTEGRPYKGWAGGGVMAVRRDVYEQTPLDPRFVGWGQEDTCWHLALSRLHGRGGRGRADLWHLWHPPQPRMSRGIGSQESADLLHRYQRAHSTNAMTRLLQEVTG